MGVITECSFLENQAVAGGGAGFGQSYLNGFGCGGGIYTAGNLELDRCSFYCNQVYGATGVVFNGGTASDGGFALGGGDFNSSHRAMTNCTLALNSAVAGSGSANGFPGHNGIALGAGVFNSNGVSLMMNDSVASNACMAYGPGFYGTNGIAAGMEIGNTNGMFNLHSTIIAYGATNGNAYGAITDDGYNICSDGSANLFSGSSFNYTDPQLAPLADYGGPTLCMALLPTSPAIDYGDPADFPNIDQRGFFRPVGAGADIGAYEFGSFPLVIPTLTIAGTASNVLLSFMAAMPTAYCLQTSTNLTTWTDMETNGPFAGATNVTQSVSQQRF